MSLDTDDYLDGNAAAGELSNIFAMDVTSAEGQCAHCGASVCATGLVGRTKFKIK
jgi:Family of unknown function (DUF6510)